MWDLNLQTFLYPLMLMNRFEEDIARFTYLVGDTKSGKLKMETRIRTREECENKLTEAMNLYREAQLFDERPTRRNKLC